MPVGTTASRSGCDGCDLFVQPVATQVTPYFANRENVEGDAQIANGANSTPANWGPPGLGFASGIAGLSDATSTYNRPETNSLSYNVEWYTSGTTSSSAGTFAGRSSTFGRRRTRRGRLVLPARPRRARSTGLPRAGRTLRTFAGDSRHQQHCVWQRGQVPSPIRLRSVCARRLPCELGVQRELGIRWEYGAPVTELKGRLVNLDVGPGFTAEQAVLASSPVGALTGQSYPTSLVRPDKNGVAPNVGLRGGRSRGRRC